MPRPPKQWFYKTLKRVRRQYPFRSKRAQARITAGIWWRKYSPRIRAKIIKKYG